jgi:hypothetical protein
MLRAGIVIVALTSATLVQAQHSKRDAAKLAADMDAILKQAYTGKPAHKTPPPRPPRVATKEAAPPEKIARPPQSEANGDVVGDIIVRSVRLALDPNVWVASVPKTGAEWKEHLDRIPKTPAEVDAHLRRLDAALRAHRR